MQMVEPEIIGTHEMATRAKTMDDTRLAPIGLEPHYHWFTRVVTALSPEDGSVLDVGAGGALPSALRPIREKARYLAGVDPSPTIADHADLDDHWINRLEEAALPSERFDVAFAYNVVEHIDVPEPFLRALGETLKPGGGFVLLTPNAAHPFAVLARGLEILQLKPIMRSLIGKQESGHYAVNDYPAYYRMNRLGRLAPLARRTGFRVRQAVYFPSGWKHYFPAPLRFVPRAYDALTRRYFPAGQLLFAAVLEKVGGEG